MISYVKRTKLAARLEAVLIKELTLDFGDDVADAVYDKLDYLYVKLDEDDYLDILEYLLGRIDSIDDDLMAMIAGIPIPVMAV